MQALAEVLERLLPEPASISGISPEAAIGGVALAALAAKRLAANAKTGAAGMAAAAAVADTAADTAAAAAAAASAAARPKRRHSAEPTRTPSLAPATTLQRAPSLSALPAGTPRANLKHIGYTCTLTLTP